MPQAKPYLFDIHPYQGGKSKVQGQEEVIKLSSNESPFGAPVAAVKAYQNIASTLHRYPDGNATALKEAIQARYGFCQSQIICGAGSDEIIAFLCHAYLSPGDEIIHTRHGFLMYSIYAKAAGAISMVADEKNLTADVDAILACVSNRTKIVFLANPNNPTGTYIPKSEIHRLRASLPDHILLVVDGAYSEYMLADDYSDGSELVSAANNTVMTRTFSKIYGLGGLRIGWAYCPESVADVLNRIRGPFNVSSAAIAAAAAAIEDQAFEIQCRDFNAKALREVETFIGEHASFTFHPSVANFYLVECSSEKKTVALDTYLQSNGIIARNVKAYQLPKCLRITVGTDAENHKVMEVLKRFSDE